MFKYPRRRWNTRVSIQDYVTENDKTENVAYIAIWRSIFPSEAVGLSDYSIILKLTELFLTFSVANAKYETAFFNMKKLENNYRSQLGKEPLSSQIRMVMDGNP